MKKVAVPLSMLAVGVTGGALLSTGAAVALTPAAPAAGTGAVSACVNDRTQVITLLPANRAGCKAGTTPITWSVTGPAGAPGAAGTPGVPGPRGPAGSASTAGMACVPGTKPLPLPLAGYDDTEVAALLEQYDWDGTYGIGSKSESGDGPSVYLLACASDDALEVK